MLPTGNAKTALLPSILGDVNNAGGGGAPIERENEGGREHKPEGTRGCTRPEVFGKDAMKKGDPSFQFSPVVFLFDEKFGLNSRENEENN